MGDAAAWIGFAGALLGAVAAAWGAARYSHIHALRLAWADWTAAVFQEFGVMDMLRGVQKEVPADDNLEALLHFQQKEERASNNLVRKQQRVLLLESDEEWASVLGVVSTLAIREEVKGNVLDRLHEYVRDELSLSLRKRFGTLWLEGRPPSMQWLGEPPPP